MRNPIDDSGETGSDPREPLRKQLMSMMDQVVEIDLDGIQQTAKSLNIRVEDIVPVIRAARRPAREVCDAAISTDTAPILQEANQLLGDLVTRVDTFAQALHQTRGGNQEGLNQAGASIVQMMGPSWSASPGQSHGEITWQHRARGLVVYIRSIELDGADLSAVIARARAASDEIAELRKSSEKAFEVLNDAPERWARQKFAQQYKAESSGCGWAAFGFIVLTVALGVGLVGLLGRWPVNSVRDNQWIVFFVDMLPRLVAISLLSSLILISVRGFRANYHLRVTYRHRALVLETFDLLLRDADADTKPAMLRSVADVIFKSDQTGSIGDDEPRIDQQAVALVREILAAKKGSS